MDINYELYKVFYHVANTLSFSGSLQAAVHFPVAVSQSIRYWKKKLNQPLFIRSTKRVQLTPEGEILLKHIEPAMNLIRQGENQLLEANTLNGGQLRIGASDTICRYYLVSYLKDFHRRYPNVQSRLPTRLPSPARSCWNPVRWILPSPTIRTLDFPTPRMCGSSGNSRTYSWPMTNTKN